jgi:diphosphomevalonate decarboxylase
MISKYDIAAHILKNKNNAPKAISSSCFAPANIALVKYWGKRNTELNLPITSSLSVSLGEFGTKTQISLSEQDELIINNQKIASNTDEVQRLVKFLNLFRQTNQQYFRVDCTSNIPMAAGLASSSAAFASIVKALDDLYQWQLPLNKLSILARIGSGSACRSLWQGFVKWQKGRRKDGMDSYAAPLMHTWPALRIGLLICDSQPKAISSREAMEITKKTALCYKLWPQNVKQSMMLVEKSINEHNFALLGQAAEHNALTMHAYMLAAEPTICYFSPRTVEIFHKVWKLRKEGMNIYFTQDAGANIKLIFQQEDADFLQKTFPEIKIINPFN